MPVCLRRVDIPPPCHPFLRSTTEVDIVSESETADENEEGKDWRRELRLEKTKMNLRRWNRSRERSKVKDGKGSYVMMEGEGRGWYKDEDSEELADPSAVGVLKKANPEKKEVVLKFGCQEVTFRGGDQRVGARIPEKVEKYYRGIYELFEKKIKLLEMDVEAAERVSDRECQSSNGAKNKEAKYKVSPLPKKKARLESLPPSPTLSLSGDEEILEVGSGTPGSKKRARGRLKGNTKNKSQDSKELNLDLNKKKADGGGRPKGSKNKKSLKEVVSNRYKNDPQVSINQASAPRPQSKPAHMIQHQQKVKEVMQMLRDKREKETLEEDKTRPTPPKPPKVRPLEERRKAQLIPMTAAPVPKCFKIKKSKNLDKKHKSRHSSGDSEPPRKNPKVNKDSLSVNSSPSSLPPKSKCAPPGSPSPGPSRRPRSPSSSPPSRLRSQSPPSTLTPTPASLPLPSPPPPSRPLPESSPSPPPPPLTQSSPSPPPSPPAMNSINKINLNGFDDDDDADIDLFADGSADDLLKDLTQLPSTLAPVSIRTWRK